MLLTPDQEMIRDAVRAFARVNRIDRLVVDAPGAPCQLHQTSTADQETNR